MSLKKKNKIFTKQIQECGEHGFDISGTNKASENYIRMSNFMQNKGLYIKQ